MQTRDQVQNWQLEMFHNGEWRQRFPWKGRDLKEEVWFGMTFDAACEHLKLFERRTMQGEQVKWRVVPA